MGAESATQRVDNFGASGWIEVGARGLGQARGHHVEPDRENQLDDFARRQMLHQFLHRRFIRLHPLDHFLGEAQHQPLEIAETGGIVGAPGDSIDRVLRVAA